MYAGCSLYNPRNGCTHESVSEDIHDGTVVCVNCALVLEENLPLSFPYTHTEHHIGDSFTSSKQIHVVKDIRKDHADFFEIILGKWNVNGKDQSEILRKYEKMKTNINSHKKDNYKMFAYCVYSVLSKTGYGITPDEVARTFNVKKKNMFQYQTLIDDSEYTTIRPISDKLCARLDLPFKDKKKIGEICEQYAMTSNQNLKTVCILVIYYYCCEVPYLYYVRADVKKLHQFVIPLYPILDVLYEMTYEATQVSKSLFCLIFKK